MTGKEEYCPICDGSGINKARTILHEQTNNETVMFYCNCWYGWLLKQREANKEMTVEKIPLSEVEHPWGMQKGEDGAYLYYGRSDDTFFRMIGIKVKTDKREVEGGWTQIILEEIGKGVVVLVKSVDEKGNPIFLLTSKPEPGNPADKNFVLLKPTIQASESNMAQAHGGKRPPFAELLDKYGDSVIWIEPPQDGGRFLNKVNKYAIIEITIEDMRKIALPPDARWFKLFEIGEALKSNNVNEHLSQALELEGILRE